MINCLIVTATGKEIIPFLDVLRNNRLGLTGKIGLDVLVSGIGLTATAWALSRQFQLNRPDIVIQAGIAGCFNKKIALGTVVAVKQDTIADQGVLEKGKLNSVFDMKLVAPDQFPHTRGWLVNPHGDLLRKSKLKIARSISVNQVSVTPSVIRLYHQKFHPWIESMEGAALHYGCLMEGIPFIQLRGVSNYIGERDKKKWVFAESIQNVNKALIQLLKSL